jgi:hypothetical protein
MTYRRDLFYEIVASADFQAAMVGPMIDDFVQKMKRPGADGATYRGFIEDWLYLQRPLFDRFKGVRYNVQFEGPPLIIDHRQLEWAKLDPIEARELRQRLRGAVDGIVDDWIGGRPMQYLPSIAQKPFKDRAAVDAADHAVIRDFVASRNSRTGDDQ